jgi:hypothetical protein
MGAVQPQKQAPSKAPRSKAKILTELYLDPFGRNGSTCPRSVGASTFAERAAPTTEDLPMQVCGSPLSA